MVEAKKDSLADLRRLVTLHYTLFPCAVLICSQIYVNLMVFVPTGTASCRVINYMLTDHPPRNEKDLDRFTRSHALTDQTTFLEDYAAAADCQDGIATGVLQEFTLCPAERHVWTFHRLVDDVVNGREPVQVLPEAAE
jgi:hypothetical protein